MAKSRYELKVNQGLRSGISDYLAEDRRAHDEKYGRGARRPPRIRVTEAQKVELELAAMAALTALQESQAKLLKGQSLTMVERNSNQKAMYEIIAGMLEKEMGGFSTQNSSRITSSTTRETKLRDQAAKELEAIVQSGPMDAKLQGEVAGIAAHLNDQDFGPAMTQLLDNQDSIREHWPAMVAQLTLKTGYSPEQLHDTLLKSAMNANQTKLISAIEDNSARITSVLGKADRLLEEADIAQEDGSRLIGMSGAGRSFIQKAYSAADGDPTEAAAALGIDLTGPMPENEITKQARALAGRLADRIDGMENDLTSEEEYDALLAGPELAEYAKERGYEVDQMSSGEKRQLLDDTIVEHHRNEKKRKKAARTDDAFETFKDMVPMGEQPQVSDAIEALLYSMANPLTILREGIERGPVRNFFMKLVADGKKRRATKREEEIDGVEFGQPDLNEITEGDPEEARSLPEGEAPFTDITKLSDAEKTAYGEENGLAAMPEEPQVEEPEAEIVTSPEERSARLDAAGATFVAHAAGDDYGPYGEFPDGTVGFIHPETGRLVRVSRGQQGFNEILETLGGPGQAPGGQEEPLSGSPETPPGQPEGGNGVVGGVLGGILGDEEEPPVTGKPVTHLGTEYIKGRVPTVRPPPEEILSQGQKQDLVDEMPDESGDDYSSPREDPLAGQDLSANDPQGQRGDSGVEGRRAAQVQPGHWDRLREEAQARKAGLEAEVAGQTMPGGTDTDIANLRTPTDPLAYDDLSPTDPAGPEGDAQEAAAAKTEKDFPEGTEEQLQGLRAGPPQSLDEVLEAIGSSVEGLTLRQAQRLLDRLTEKGAPESIIQDLLTRWNEAYPQGGPAEEEVADRESRPPEAAPEVEAEAEADVPDLMGGKPIRVVADPSSRDPFQSGGGDKEEIEIDIDGPEEPPVDAAEQLVAEPEPPAPGEEEKKASGGGGEEGEKKEEEEEKGKPRGGEELRGYNAPPKEFMPGGNQYQKPSAPEATAFEIDKMGVAPVRHAPGAQIMGPANISAAETGESKNPAKKKKAALSFGEALKKSALEKKAQDLAPQTSQPAQ